MANRAIFNCKYSIHDLSRCTGEGSDNFARFNMPLELGMAMARRFMDPDHDWLVLIPREHAHLQFISGFGGLRSAYPRRFDDKCHSRSRLLVSYARMSLYRRSRPWPSCGSFRRFKGRRLDLDSAWSGYLPWAEVIIAATEIAKELD